MRELMVRGNWTSAIFWIDSLIGSYNIIWYFIVFILTSPRSILTSLPLNFMTFFFFLITSPHSSLCWHLLLDVRLAMEQGQPLRSQTLKENWPSLPQEPAVYGPSFRVGLVKPSPLCAQGLADLILCQFCKGKRNTSAFVSEVGSVICRGSFILWQYFLSFSVARDWT